MSAMLDHVVAQVLTLQVRLLACRERLAADVDSEALHDLRTTTRRLRSLLRPLRGLPAVDQLEDAARALGALTTPLRDREVLAAELRERGQQDAAERRLRGRAQTCRCGRESRVDAHAGDHRRVSGVSAGSGSRRPGQRPAKTRRQTPR